jgi:hypothetical protein
MERTQEKHSTKLSHLAGGMSDYALAVKGLSGEHTEIYRRIEELEDEARCGLEPDTVRALPQRVHDTERELQELVVWREEAKEKDIRLRGYRTLLTVAVISAAASLLVALITAGAALLKG